MSSAIASVPRREILRLAAASVAALPLVASGRIHNADTSRVVRVYSPEATKEWDYSSNFPWDHTVEQTPEHPGKIKERYYDYINDDVVARMLDLGLRDLTGAENATAAWKALLVGYRPGQRITLKLNMNNASFNEAITTNRMDQTMPLVNAVLSMLIDGLSVEPDNITLLDAQRWFHPIIMKGRCRYPGVRWVDSKTPDRWDPSESVTFTRDHPAPGGNFWMPRDYTQADHIINFCLMKAHGCGITGAMKSHFGSIPSPKWLHEGMGQKSYIADLCATPSIRNKVRLNLVDALFASWFGPVWAPRPWKTFPQPSPNSLLLSRDPVALDTVMLDHIRDELKAIGSAAPSHVLEWVENPTFLEYAMTHHGLGVYDTRPYSRIDYRELSL
jgi:uncharacterized protein (DUF362 family)